MSGLNARLFPAAFPIYNSLQGATACVRTEALQGTSPLLREAFVTARPITRPREKNVS